MKPFNVLKNLLPLLCVISDITYEILSIVLILEAQLLELSFKVNVRRHSI